jgi:glycosyltransferase involved in cell wall biosynthesis
MLSISHSLPETRPSKLTAAIVVADCAFVNGGNGQVALSTAVALAQSGVETTLFAASGPVAPVLLDIPHLTVVCLDQPEVLNDPSIARGAIRGLWNFRAAGELRKVLSACDPATTIVHLHSWSKALSSSVARAAFDAKFPVVVTIHDYFSFCPNGSLYDHEKQEPCTLVPMSVACAAANCDPRNRAHKAYRVARQFIAERIAGLPSGIENFICVSAFSRAIAQPHLGNARIFDVDNPIEATPETPVDVRKNDEFVYIGRLSREKGADVFAEAAAIAGVKAVFVGDGPLDETMRQLAPHAEFTGWLAPRCVRGSHARAPSCFRRVGTKHLHSSFPKHLRWAFRRSCPTAAPRVARSSTESAE